MKNFFRIVSFSLLTFLVLHPDVYAMDQMKVVYFYDFKPYSWKSENGPMKGILIDILNESLHNKMGIDITHEGYPWARAQVYVKAGDADAFVTIPTPERKTYTIISSEVVIDRKATLFTYRNNPMIKILNNVKSIPDLKDFKQIQYIGNGWAKKNFNGMDVRWVPSLKEVLRRLARGKYDYFVASSLIVNHNIKALGYQDKIEELPNVVLAKDAFHLCISKKSPFNKIIPEFDQTIKKMRQDGTLKKIFNKYRNQISIK